MGTESLNLRVLEVFLENPAESFAAADVQQRSGLTCGTLYPILLQLEFTGYFVSCWEQFDRSGAAPPRRRLYRLTANGLVRAGALSAGFNRGVFA
jgi:PadR family transcriptional regulator, regulatory protein PadR